MFFMNLSVHLKLHLKQTFDYFSIFVRKFTRFLMKMYDF